VVISIIAILAALLLPAMRVVKDMAAQLSCANDLRQAGTFMMQYAADNDGRLPGGGHDGNGSVSWNSIMNTEMLADEAVKMPRWGQTKADELGCTVYVDTGLYRRKWVMNGNANGGYSSTTNTALYGVMFLPPTTRFPNYTKWNSYWLGAAIDRFAKKPLKGLIVEVEGSGDTTTNLSSVYFRHRGGKSSNALYLDGHVQALAAPVSSSVLQFGLP